MSDYFSIFLFSLLAWGMSFFLIYLVRNFDRLPFVILHYLIDVVVFGLVFLAYFRYFDGLSSFTVMAVAMMSLFIFEFIFWNFFDLGTGNFLNFVDWIVPAFLIASVIYFIGEHSDKLT